MSIEWDIEELAYRALGKTSSETDDAINNGDIDEAIFEKYDTDFDTYCKIVKDLLPFTPLVESPLSKEIYHAFVDVKESRAIVKLPITRSK